eukprot:121585_1
MGKKSKNPGKAKSSETAASPAVAYPSDGPSEEELNCLQTSSSSLQAKLDQLTSFAVANDRKGFVENFVPLELTPEDTQGYLEDLTTADEADGQWRNLISEIAAIAAGKGVNNIEGDQVTNAVFFFEHPLLEQCDREVSFVCTNGEWRAEG